MLDLKFKKGLHYFYSRKSKN